ncbi:immunoglobulin domain-containing protein [Lutibacter sp.]|uniref:Ig-like domain-containing protein n=1 Tax=Lutibacter sp. TaxID=1925666 RepID=UPI001A1D0567|nr:immunoglobulin domain-containing protein [Lutibacter sp.]MBI9039855.1 immunoglobulin domain-containing protein [Lutibacter sp.]
MTKAPNHSRRSYTYLLIVLLTTFTSFTGTYSKNLATLHSGATHIGNPILGDAGTITIINDTGGGFITTKVDKGNLNGSLFAPSISIQPIASQTVCEGSQISLSISATGIGTLTYQWKKNGVDLSDNVFITGSTLPTLVINPSQGSDAGSYTCLVTDTSDSVTLLSNPATIIVNALPTVLAGSPQTVCEGTSITLAGSGATSYLWDNGILDNTAFIATTTTTYTVTGTDANGCKNTDAVTITVNALPTTPTTTVIQPTCSVATGSINFSGLPTTGGNWTINTLPIPINGNTATYTLTGVAPGTYNYTLTHNGCTSLPTLDATVNAQPIIPTAPTVNNTTQPTCTLATGSVDLSGLPSIGGWTISVLKSGVLQNTTTNSGSTFPISGLIPGNYTFTVSNGNCSSVESTNVIIFPQPTITAPILGTTVQPTCSLATGSVTLNGLPTATPWTLTRSPGGVTTTGSAASITISGLITGTYTYTVEDINGCISAASSTITIDPQPATPAVPTATAQSFTGGTPTVGDLVATGDVLATFNWYTSATGGIPLTNATNLITGTYYVSQVLNGCESARASVLVNVFPNSVGGTVSSGTTVCSGTNSTLLTLSSYTGIVSKWQSSPVSDFSSSVIDIPLSASPSLTVTNLTGSLYFRAVVVSGTSTNYSAPAFMEVIPQSVGGTITSADPTTFCAGGTINLSLTGYTGTSFQWESKIPSGSWTPITNAITPNYTATNLTQTTLFRVAVQNSICSTVYSAPDFTVTVNQLPALPTNLTSDNKCFGETVTVGVPPGTSPTTYAYSWSNSVGTVLNGTSQFTFIVYNDETYTLTLTDTATGCISTASFNINMIPLPAAAVILPTSICEGNSIAIGATAIPGSTYGWSSIPAGFSFPNSNPTVSPTVTTTYTLTETNLGCSASNSVTITVEPNPIISIAGSPSIAICETALNHFIGASIVNNYNAFKWEVIPANAGSLVNITANGADFTPSATGIATGSATVRLTVTNTCGVDDFKEIVVNIDRQSIADAGTGGTTCGTNPIPLNGSASQFATTYTWTKPIGITGTLSGANTATPTYTPSAADVFNAATLSPVTFTLITTSGSSCVPSAPATVQVDIVPPPIISAGPSVTTICEDGFYTTNLATKDVNTVSVSWSNNGGDGTFGNPSNLSTTYTPGPQDKVNGTVTLTLTAVGNSPCASVPSSIVLNIEKNPVVNLGADVLVCGSPINPFNIVPVTLLNPGTIMWTSNGNGSFVNPTAISPIYIPAATDLNTAVTFTVTVAPINPCGTPASDSVIYTINATPTVIAGGDATICETQPSYQLQSFVTNASLITWNKGAGTGSFDNINDQNPVYTLSPNDINLGSITFTVEVSQPGCTPVSDTMKLTIQKNPTVNIGGPYEICQGQSQILNGSAPNSSSVLWTRSSGSGTFIGTTTLNPEYISNSSETGTITFILTADPIGPCATPVSNITQLVIVANPTADAGNNANICEGDPFTINTAAATDYAGTGGSTGLLWSTSGSGSFTGGNTLTPTYTPSTSDNNNGSVVLTLTASNVNAPCFNDAVDQMTLTINKIPSINVINTALPVCTETTPFEIIGVSANDYDTLQWTTSGSGTFSPSSTPLNTVDALFYNPSTADVATGSVILTLEAARNPLNCNSSTTNTVILNFVKEPIVDAGPANATICEDSYYPTNDATAQFNNLVVWTSDGSGSWNGTQNSLNNAAYTPSTADIAIGFVTLRLTATGDPVCGETAEDTIILNIEALPVITTTGTDAICESSTSYPISGTSITNSYTAVTLANWTSTGTGTFTSSGDPLNPIYTPTAADIASGQVTLTLTVNPVAPCLAPQPETIILDFISEPIVTATPDLNRCETPFQINNVSATPGTYSNIVWTTAGAGSFLGGINNVVNPTYIPLGSDISTGIVALTLTVNPTSPCAVPFVKTMTFNIAKLPVINVANQAPICEDATNVQVLGTTVTNALSFVYTSTTGTTINNPTSLNPTVTPSATDITNGYIELTIEATPTTNCATEGPFTETVIIPIINNPIVNAGTGTPICEGSTITTSSATANAAALGNLQWTGSGTFITSSTNLVTTYQPTATEIANGSVTLTLTGTATAPCATNAVSTVTYTILKNPVVTVNPTTVEICEDATYRVQPGQIVITNMSSVANVVWAATSPGTILQGSTLDLEPIFTPSLTDIGNGYSDLTITVTPKGACSANTVSETIRVNIAPAATIDATQANYTFCEGTNKALTAIFTNHNPATYNWSIISGTGTISVANIANPSYIPASDSDVVVIRVSVTGNAPCDQVVFEEFTLNKISTPIVKLPLNATTICSTQTSYNLSANVTNTSPSISYLWTSSSSSATFSNPTSTTSTYTFTGADIANGSVILRLTATSDAICALTDFDEIVISIDDAPTVTITSLTTPICEGTTYNAVATATDASTYLWEPVGASDGAFTNANSLNAIYTPGANDILSGSFTIQVTATGATSCGTAVKQQTVNIIPLPTVAVGVVNRTNCASAPFVITGVTATNNSNLLWTSQSGTPGTFSNNSIQNPVYTPSAAEIAANVPIVLRVTAQPITPCTGPVFDEIILTLSPVQVVDAGLPQSICEDGIVNLVGSATNSSSVYWTTSSSATDTQFSTPTIATTSYTPSALDIATGTVTLTLHAVSATNCPEITDTILVTIVKKPTANAGGPVTICEGLPYTLAASEATAQNYANLLWTVSGGGSITAGATTLTPTFTPSVGLTGDVTLTLTALAKTSCGASNNAVATKIITIVPSPFVAVPATKTICQGTPLTILASEVTATNYSSVSWSSSNGLGTFSPATSTTTAATVYTPAAGQTGTVNLILTAHATDASCSDASSSISVTIEPALIVEAGIGGTICEDETFTILGASILNGNGVFSWSIVGPATIVAGTANTWNPEIIPNAGASGTVTLTLTANGTSNCPTPKTDSVTITINPLPIVDAGAPITACEGVTSIPITGTASNGGTYTWTHTGAGSIQTTADPLKVNYIPGAGDFINPSGSTVVQISLEATGTGTCGTVQDFMEITLFANPKVFAGTNASICEGATYALIGATATNYSSITWDDGIANGTFDYTGSGGLLNPTYILNPADSGIITITMTVEPNTACLPTASVFKDSMQLTVEKNPTIVASTTEITLCGESFTLPDVITVNNASSISWVNVTAVSPVSSPANATTETPTLSPTIAELANGFMLLEVTAFPLNKCSTNAIETIKVNLAPKVTIGTLNPITKCETASPILLNFGASVSPSTTFTWTEDGAGTITAGANTLTPTYTPGANETGIITFTLRAANPPPCLGETTATVTLTLTPQPTAYAGADATVCAGTPYNLVNATATHYSSISWESYISSAGIATSDGVFSIIPNDPKATYTPSTNDISRGFVYLFVTATNSCGSFTDVMRLNITPGVGVFAGVPATICEGSTYTLSNATATNSTSVSWTSSENSNGTSNPTYIGGTFNTSTSALNATYTPSADDINRGFVYLTLTGTGDSTCAIATSVMRLDITRNPSIAITTSTVDICVNTPSVVLNSVAANYNTISWSIFSGPGSITSGASTATPTFTTGLPSSIITTQTTVARALLTPINGCSAAITADITITIQPLPTVEAGDNGEVCYIAGNPINAFTINNSSVTNASSKVWSTSGSGTFGNGTPPTYQSLSNSCPSTEDLTLTATGVGACNTSTISDIVTLTINCAAPNLGAITSSVGTTLCAGTTNVMYQVATNPSVTTYNWTVPTGATIVSGINTNIITVDYGANSVSGNVSVYATNSCGNGPFSTLAITVLPVPAATTISGLTPVCAGATGIVYTATPIPGATSYIWTLPTGATGSSITNTITVDFGLSAVSGNITVQGVNSCGNGVVSSLPITVIAPPTLTNTTTTPICSGDLFTHTLTSSAGVTFTWDRYLQSGIDNTASGTGSTITETLVNSTNVVQTATYTVTLTSPTGCISTEYVSVAIYPAGLLTNTPAVTTICSGTSINYTPTSNPTGIITWSRITTSGITPTGSTGNATPINEILTNTTNAVITVAYELTLPTTINGCTNTVTVSVDVTPTPSAAANLAGPTTVCAGSTGNVYTVDSIDNATSYEWTLPNGSSQSTTTNTLSINYLLTDVTGNLTVFGRNACDDGPSVTLSITVIAPVVVTITNPLVICAGQTADLSAAVSTAVTNTVTYWTDAAATTSLTNPTAVSAGTYYIKATNTTGCFTIVPVVVTAQTLPIVTVNSETICEGAITNIMATPTSLGTYSYNWTSIPATAINPGNVASFTTAIAGNYTVEITDTAAPNCTSLPATGTVTVNPLPTATIAVPATVCENGTAVVTFTGVNGIPPYTFDYNINGGATQTISTTSTSNTVTLPVVTTVSGSFNYQLISVSESSATMCSQLQTGSATINIVAPPTVAITNPLVICAGQTANLSAAVSTAVTNTVTYWNDAAANVTPLTNFTAVTAGTYYIKATNSITGCFTIKPVVVTEQALPTVTVNNPPTICADGTLATITATPTSLGTYSYTWTSIPATAINPGNVASFSTAIAGNYTVEITDTTAPNCTSLPATGTVTVNPLPTATIAVPATVCENGTAVVTFTGVNGIPPYTFDYNINGGATQTISTTSTSNTVTLPVVTTVSGSFNYQLISVSESSATMCSQLQTGSATINIVAPPTVAITNPLVICAGQTANLSAAVSTAVTNTVTYWNDAAANTAAVTNFTAVTAGTYYIKATNSITGCFTIEPVTVIANPLPQLTSTQPAAICSGDIFNTYIPTSDTAGTYSWIRYTIGAINESGANGSGTAGIDVISDGILTNNTVSPVTVTYYITLPTTGFGCTDTKTIDIVVNPTPSTGTVITGPETVCEGSTGNVYSIASIPNATSYLWTLPDGSTSTTLSNSITINYTALTSGTLTVKGKNVCGTGLASPPLSITVIAPPTLSSTLTPTNVCSNTVLTYVPTSVTPNVSYSWTRAIKAGISNGVGLGNGNINETLFNTTNGDVSVDYIYTLITPNGCTNTETVTVIVNPTYHLTSSTAITTICSGDTFSYVATSDDPSNGAITWSRASIVGINEVGNTGSPAPISETLTNSSNTLIPVSYKLILPSTPNGCLNTTTIIVNVKPSLTATISGGGTTCLNSTNNLITFTGSNGTAPYTFEYAIDGTAGYTATSASGNSVQLVTSSSVVGPHTYTLTGITDSSPTACSTDLTTSIIDKIIDVRNLPVLVITNPPTICANETADLENPAITIGSTVQPLQLSYWLDAAGTLPFYNYNTATAGTYYIKAENVDGCTVIEPVVVTTAPVPTVSVNSPTICADGTLATLTATPGVPGSYNYTWTGPSGPNPGNVASFSTDIPGIYTVKITNTLIPTCESSIATAVVTVNPLPEATILGTTSVCLNEPATITFKGTLGTAPYIFEYIDAMGSTQTATSIVNTATVSVPTNTAGNFNYTLIGVTDFNGCEQVLSIAPITITVYPTPNLVITNPTNICEGTTADLTDPAVTAGSDSGLTFTYHTSINATTSNELSSNNVPEGTYYIKAEDLTTGCFIIKPVVVTSVALPIVTVTNETICEGAIATIKASPGLGSTGVYDYNWTVTPGAFTPGNVASFDTPISLASGTYTYTVSITDRNAPFCESATASGTVTVNPLPNDALAISGPTPVCAGSTGNVYTVAIITNATSYNWTLPAGATIVSGTNTNSITVDYDTTAVSGNISVYGSNVCGDGNVSANYPITVNELPIVEIEGGLPEIEVCAGQSVTLTATGANTYVWGSGDTGATYTFTPIISSTYTVIGTSNGCDATAEILVTVKPALTGTIQAPYDFTVCKDAIPLTITFEGANGTAPYIFTYEIASTLLATPITGTVTSIGTDATLVPDLPTSIPGNFTVTLISIEDSGSCNNGEILEPSQAFITVLDAGIVPAANNLINVNQTVCEGEAITAIVFDISGAPDDAFVEGLPGDVIGTYDETAGTLTISGKPNESGTFDYTVKTSSSIIGCNSEFSGTIEVNAKGTLSLAVAGTDEQAICINTPITAITYNLEGSATNVEVLNLPAGVTYSTTATTVTISGTPSVAGEFKYAINPFSTTTNCDQIPEEGTITVSESEITLVSGEPEQTICIDNAIEAIKYSISNTPGTPIINTPAELILVGTLPTGVTFDSTTGIISGIPTEGGTFSYSIEASTGCATPLSGIIEVIDTLPTVEIEGSLTEIEVCIGSEITLTATGADTYKWYNSDPLGGSSTTPLSTNETYTYTPSENHIIYVVGSVAGGCENIAELNVILKQPLTASITGVNVFDVCKDADEPEITFTATNGTAPYTFTYTINGIENTVVTGNNSNSFIIKVPTNVADTYIIELTNVEDSANDAYCSPPTLLEPTTATVTVVESGITPQPGAAIFQTVCEGSAITDIQFDILGNAMNAFVQGLPSGVASSFAGNVLKISGIPTVTGTFEYTVTTSGLATGCNASFKGTITINPNDSITLLSAGNDNQEICVNNSIAPITYQLENGASGATITGLPSGIIWNLVGNVLTISGTVNDLAAVYTYTIATQGICASATATGTITITALGTLSRTQGNQNEIVCVNTVLTNPIQYQGNAGQTLQLNGVLPPGVTFIADPATGSAVINGKPTLSGTYNYSITSDSNCSVRLDGSIVVQKNAFINLVSGSINQMNCVGSPIEPLRYAIPINVTTTNNIITPALPTGINYVVVNGELIISGTPTTILNETVYEISVNNGCGLAKTTFKLTVETTPEITLEADSGTLTQSVCQNAPIDAIKFKLSGAATGIDESLLPAFITSTVDASGVYTLSGAPIYTGTFNFKIKTVGNASCSAELDVNITNLYAAVSIELASATDTDNQTVCSISTPIIDIVYDIIGNITNPALISVTGLPSGVTATSITTTTGLKLTISGTPTASGIYEYGIEYNSCGGAIENGSISISSPATINGTVKQISCTGNDGEISVTIFGGIPFIDANGTPFYAINWTGGPDGTFRQNQATITGLAPGDYTFSGTDAIGCPLPTKTFTIKNKVPLSITLLSMTAPSCNNVCANFDFAGGTGIYTRFTLESFNPQSQVWSIISPPYNNYYNICGLNAGRYQLSVTDSGGCVSEPYLFTISSELSISIEALSFDENLCGSGSGIVYAKINSLDTNLTFYYNSKIISSEYLGDNIYELTFNETETLDGILKVINSQNCSVEKIISTKTVDEEMLDFEFTSFDFEAYGYYSVKENIEFTNLSFIGTPNPIVYSYALWDFGDNTPSRVFYNPEDLAFNSNGENIETVFHTYTNDGIYDVTLTIFNSSGCSTSITKTVLIGEGASILLPTAFSPNNDGINDLFRPIFRGVSEISMYIYDNWGNLVYEYTSDDARTLENDQEWGWNGIEPLNSEPKNDSYRCYILAKTLDKKVIEKNIRFLIIK